MRPLFFALLSSAALAQTTATPIPQKHIPPNVLMELRALEGQFDLSLSRDCAPEKCVSKGCIYVDHAIVDRPPSTSLPGLGQPEGPGALPAQEYLTQARCEFAHEKSVPQRDVDALIRRMEQRLSKGWLQVKVTRQILEPISPSLSESPPPKEPPKVEPPPAPVTPPTPTTPPQWEAGVALRELWLTLLPHFWWMIALFLGSLTTLVVIWGARRVGRESLEEKAMLAQLGASEPKPPEPAPAPAAVETPPVGETPTSTDSAAAAAQLAELTKQWTKRVAEADLEKEDGVVVELLRDWLKTRQFPLLAKALFVFGDRLSQALASDGELAAQKVAFAEYLRKVDPKELPTDAEFFQTLDQHGKASSLTVQADTRVFRSLKEEFGTAGLASLIERLPRHHGALLLALTPTEGQDDLARALDGNVRVELAGELLRSNRVSKEERNQVFQALDLARAGLPLSAAAAPSVHDVGDRGQVFDAAGALSILLPLMSQAERKALFAYALERTNDVFPAWWGDILFPDMLLKLPDDVRADALLEVNARSLAGWLSTQSPDLRERFTTRLSPALQTAVRANSSFASREERFEIAKRGRDELVAVMSRFTAQGRIAPGAGLA